MAATDPAARARRRIVVIVIATAALAAVVLFLKLAAPDWRKPFISYLPGHKNFVICRCNLHNLGGAMELYYQRFKRYPSTRPGLQFLLAPLKTGILGQEQETIEKIVRNAYVCPGDDHANRVIEENAWEAFRDLDNVDPRCISYAGRNTTDFPLDRRKALTEPIACCAGGPDGCRLMHGRTLLVLFLDQHVEEIDISALPGGDASTFRVGPQSPIELLRKLNKDP